MWQTRNNELINSYKQRQGLARAEPWSELERFLEREVCGVLNLNAEDMDIDKSIFSMGITSIDLIRLKRNIEKQLPPPKRHSNECVTHQSYNQSFS